MRWHIVFLSLLLVAHCRSASASSNGSLPCGYLMNGVALDLSSLDLANGADYTINTASVKYKMNICNFDGNCLLQGAAICKFDGYPVGIGFWPPYDEGDVNAFTPLDPNNLYGGLRLQFDNAPCSGASRKALTTVDFLCGQRSTVPFSFVSADPSGCAYNFTFTTELACGTVSVINFTCPSVTTANQVTTCTIQTFDINLKPVKTSLINLTSILVVQGDFTFILPTPAFGDTFKLHFIPVGTAVEFRIALPGLYPVSSGVITVREPVMDSYQLPDFDASESDNLVDVARLDRGRESVTDDVLETNDPSSGAIRMVA